MKKILTSIFLLLLPGYLFSQNQSNFFTIQVSKESDYVDDYGETGNGSSQVTLNFEDSIVNGKHQYKLWYFSCSIREGETTYGFSSSDSIDQAFDNYSKSLLSIILSPDFPSLSAQYQTIYSKTNPEFQSLIPAILDTAVISQVIKSYARLQNEKDIRSEKISYNFLDGLSGIYEPLSIHQNETDSVKKIVRTFELKPKPVSYLIELGETVGNYEPNNSGKNELKQYFIFSDDGETLINIKWIQNYDCTGYFGINEWEGLTFNETGKIEIELFRFGE